MLFFFFFIYHLVYSYTQAGQIFMSAMHLSTEARGRVQQCESYKLPSIPFWLSGELKEKLHTHTQFIYTLPVTRGECLDV